MFSLHESRSRHLQSLSHAVHPSVAPKDGNLTTLDQDCRGEGVQPNLAIASWVCNMCHTETPFWQTVTAALSVGQPYTYTRVHSKHQRCYISIFTLLSLFWNEKKNVGHYFLSNPLKKCYLFSVQVRTFCVLIALCRPFQNQECCDLPLSSLIMLSVRTEQVICSYCTYRHIHVTVVWLLVFGHCTVSTSYQNTSNFCHSKPLQWTCRI